MAKLERTYNVPLRREWLKAPKYRRSKKAVAALRQFLQKHMKSDVVKLSKRLSVTVEKERDEIVESRSNQATKSQATRQSEYAASVDYNVNDVPFVQTKLSSGIRFVLPLDPFVKLRFSKSFNTTLVDIHMEQMFTYYRQDYFSEYTQLAFSKQVSKNWSVSESNNLSWSDSNDKFVLRNSLNINQRIDVRKSLSYSFGANAFLVPTYHYTTYDASVGYNQLLYKNWLFGFLAIGSEFSKANDWNQSSFVVLRTEIIFQ